jgi:hypothetical protein
MKRVRRNGNGNGAKRRRATDPRALDFLQAMLSLGSVASLLPVQRKGPLKARPR